MDFDEAAWESVDGDVDRVRRIGWGGLILWTSFAAVVSIWTVNSYVPNHSVPLGGIQTAWLAPLSWVFMAGIGLYGLTYSSRWEPLVARLWIGSPGLRLGLAFRTVTAPWSRVERIEADSVVIRGVLGGSVRFALTYQQASRLHRFVQAAG